MLETLLSPLSLKARLTCQKSMLVAAWLIARFGARFLCFHFSTSRQATKVPAWLAPEPDQVPSPPPPRFQGYVGLTRFPFVPWLQGARVSPTAGMKKWEPRKWRCSHRADAIVGSILFSFVPSSAALGYGVGTLTPVFVHLAGRTFGRGGGAANERSNELWWPTRCRHVCVKIFYCCAIRTFFLQ